MSDPLTLVSMYVVPDCNIPIDIILISRDLQHLGGHTHNLATYSDGFTPDIPPDSQLSFGVEEVKYDEDGDTLRLLLHFMHRCKPPSLWDLLFCELEDFAYAAHKYRVFSAISAANFSME
jgi:hypothetical protein